MHGRYSGVPDPVLVPVCHYYKVWRGDLAGEVVKEEIQTEDDQYTNTPTNTPPPIRPINLAIEGDNIDNMEDNEDNENTDVTSMPSHIASQSKNKGDTVVGNSVNINIGDAKKTVKDYYEELMETNKKECRVKEELHQ